MKKNFIYLFVMFSSLIYAKDDNPIKHNINVFAESRNDYILKGTDKIGNIDGTDPELIFEVGSEIKFQVNAPGHPFYLKVEAGIGKKNQIPEIENNGTAKGLIIWTPSKKGTYYYQCGKHKNMVGVIKII
jgi:plastocyanin